MGTRIYGLLEHDLSDYRDREAVLARLAPSLPAAFAVRDYWLFAAPESPHSLLVEWQAERVSPGDGDLRRYTGPGSLFLTLRERTARIHTGGRWRGFLSIEPLRRVHLAAFRQIAGALGTHCLALCAQSCEVDDLFLDGKSLEECIAEMERMWGSPQRSVARIEPRVVQQAERGVPLVWFLDGTKALT